MRKTSTLLLCGAVICGLASLTLTHTAQADETLAGGQDTDTVLALENFVGTLSVKTGNVDEVRIVTSKNMDDVRLKEEGGNLYIDGGIDDPDGNKCSGYYGKYSWSLFKKKEREGQFGGYEDLDDYPTLTIEAPEDVTVKIRNAIPFAEFENVGAAYANVDHCGKLVFADISGMADFSIRGSGDISAQNTGDLDVSIKGSGDVEVAASGETKIQLMGSGDVEIGETKNLDVRLYGSGDIEIDTVEGYLQAASKGSGDIEMDRVTGGLSYDGRGSGDFEVDSVDGEIEIYVAGSGDVMIDGGEASELTVTASGASDVRFGGTVENAELKASGASDIYVKKVTGQLRQRDSGASDITVGSH